MPRKSKYGNMPSVPEYKARIKGDAGLYEVWGIDWMHHTVLLNRAGLEWTPIKNVTFVPLEVSEAEASEESDE
ncbi:hypothetical protein [Pseudomonas saliphila]|uniref:hypothetical protein n=1 Tax=Pseudomonas saliphila TaxID=2586906 RepID=UPI00123889F4|nr:hypothetical protein [Pseudomonas saliphila]